MSPSSSVDVLIVDHHSNARDTIRQAVESTRDMTVVDEAGSAREGLSLIEDLGPDVATVDLSLWDGNGLDLLESVQTRDVETRGLVFTRYDEEDYAERALRAGAWGYVMKSAPKDTLLEAIREVNQGRVYVSPEMTAHLLTDLIRGDGEKLSSPLDKLTEREAEVFRLMGEGLPLDDIAKALNVERSTVESDQRRAKVKLGFDSAAELRSHAVRWTMLQAPEREEVEKRKKVETRPAGGRSSSISS